MFYDLFCELCHKKGLSPSAAAKEIGFNRASVTMWKNSGNAPKQDLLVKIADFFGVSTDYLLGKEKEKPTIVIDGELREVIETYIERPDMQAVFHSTRELTTEEIDAVLQMIKIMKHK